MTDAQWYEDEAKQQAQNTVAFNALESWAMQEANGLEDAGRDICGASLYTFTAAFLGNEPGCSAYEERTSRKTVFFDEFGVAWADSETNNHYRYFNKFGIPIDRIEAAARAKRSEINFDAEVAAEIENWKAKNPFETWLADQDGY